MGPLDVLILYNPSQDILVLENYHYFPPHHVMGDFNAHHSHWEMSLSAAQQNRAGTLLVDFPARSASFSLLTPPDLPTRTDPTTGRASTLDFCLY